MSLEHSMLPRRFSVPDENDQGGSAFQYGRTGSTHVTPLLEAEVFHETESRRNDQDGLDISFNGDPWSGVFSYLTAQCHDNPVKAGLLTITGNSFNPSYVGVLSHVIQKDWNGYWCSANEPNSYIAFDFLDHKLKLTHYTLKTYNASPQWRHIKSWVVEGCNSGTWKEIHRIKRGNYLNGPIKVASFPVRNSAYYQSIRIRMIGPNHYGDYHLFLMGIEFFGVLD